MGIRRQKGVIGGKAAADGGKETVRK